VDFLNRNPGEASLLILDNFEQLLRDPETAPPGDTSFGKGPALVRLLLERAPGLTCLVTSRQPLYLSGEQEFPVPTLPVPEGSDLAPTRLVECASVAL